MCVNVMIMCCMCCMRVNGKCAGWFLNLVSRRSWEKTCSKIRVNESKHILSSPRYVFYVLYYTKYVHIYYVHMCIECKILPGSMPYTQGVRVSSEEV